MSFPLCHRLFYNDYKVRQGCSFYASLPFILQKTVELKHDIQKEGDLHELYL